MDLGTEKESSDNESIDQVEKDQKCRSVSMNNWRKVSAFINEDSRSAWKSTIIYNLRRI